MIVECLCIEERVESFVRKRGAKTQRVLTVMDASPAHRLLSTMDYVLSVAECETYPASFLRDKQLGIAIKTIMPLFGGRLKVGGEILNARSSKAA